MPSAGAWQMICYQRWNNCSQSPLPPVLVTIQMQALPSSCKYWQLHCLVSLHHRHCMTRHAQCGVGNITTAGHTYIDHSWHVRAMCSHAPRSAKKLVNHNHDSVLASRGGRSRPDRRAFQLNLLRSIFMPPTRMASIQTSCGASTGVTMIHSQQYHVKASREQRRLLQQEQRR